MLLFLFVVVSASNYFAGDRYVLKGDTAVMLLFDSNGKIAGIQNGVRIHLLVTSFYFTAVFKMLTFIFNIFSTFPSNNVIFTQRLKIYATKLKTCIMYRIEHFW